MAVTRRRFLREVSRAGAAASLALTGCRRRIAAVNPIPNGVTIGEAGDRNGILAGSAVSVRTLRESAAYADLVRTQCRIVVAENDMKFERLRPSPETFFFDDSDYLFSFAERSRILVRGHNFMWHRQLPPWFASYAKPANAERLLVDHIQTVGRRYAGRVQSWDVVNEVIHPPDGLPGGLRDTPWYRLLGAGGIDLAFRTARLADPHALLCCNDYGIESEAPEQAAKRAAVLEFLRGLKHRGVPIDGMGIQAHLSAGPEHRYGAGLKRFMAEVQRMDLKLLITEMDVNDRDLGPAPLERDREVARVYEQFLKTALANPNTIAMLTWGLTDRYTWLNSEKSRPDHLAERCLPFDDELRPVPAYDAEVQALLQAPTRPLVAGRA